MLVKPEYDQNKNENKASSVRSRTTMRMTTRTRPVKQS